MKPIFSGKILADKIKVKYSLPDIDRGVNYLLCDLIGLTKGTDLSPSASLIYSWLAKGGAGATYLYYLGKIFDCPLEEFFENEQKVE